MDAAIEDIEEADADGTATETISPDAVRKLANAHFAQGDYGTALPLYSLAIDGCRGLAARQGVDDTGDNSAMMKAEEEEEEEEGENGEGEEGEEEETPSPLVVHLCNRSACLYRMERYDEALVDAAEAVQLAAAAADASEGNGNDDDDGDDDNDGGDYHGHHAKASFRLARTQIRLGLGEGAVRTVRAALERMDRLQEGRQVRSNTDEGDSSNTSGANTGGDGVDDADGAEPVLTTDDDEEAARGNSLEVQRAELERLLRHAERAALAGQRRSKTDGSSAAAAPLPPPQDLTVEPRTPSIREFTLDAEIGQGNFSRVVICTHKVTTQRFALKIIEKKKVEQLAKRQHPNVHNEVRMERRVLEDRLPPPPDSTTTTDNNAITDNANASASNDPRRRHIVTLHHSFQDYGSLYFLQELHDANGDLWSALRAGSKMVGTHRGLARRYAWELLGAVEYLHARGIVHRDLKPEVSLLVYWRGVGGVYPLCPRYLSQPAHILLYISIFNFIFPSPLDIVEPLIGNSHRTASWTRMVTSSCWTLAPARTWCGAT